MEPGAAVALLRPSDPGPRARLLALAAEPQKDIVSLDYAGRCARYLRQRGIAYDPARLSIDRLTPRQRRRALKKERHASSWRPNWSYGIDDYDDNDYDGLDHDPRCTHCDGEIWVECDDPIQCCDPRCDGEFHPDPACGGTGLARHQVIW